MLGCWLVSIYHVFQDRVLPEYGGKKSASNQGDQKKPKAFFQGYFPIKPQNLLFIAQDDFGQKQDNLFAL